MNKESVVKDLVDAHLRIKDEEMLTAIWIRQAEAPIWLVELLPGFADDDEAEHPTVFAASQHGYDLHLIAGNDKSLRQAIKRDVDLAKAVADGSILFGPAKGNELKDLAREAVAAAASVGRV